MGLRLSTLSAGLKAVVDGGGAMPEPVDREEVWRAAKSGREGSGKEAADHRALLEAWWAVRRAARERRMGAVGTEVVV